MHELGLAEDVLKKIKEEANAKGLARVAYAKVNIGETLISDQAEFEEIFSMISAGSVAEGMKLEIEVLPLKAVCRDCRTEFHPKNFSLDCFHCGSTNLQISSGRELILQELN